MGDKIILSLGDRLIELTPAEAKQLWEKLNAMFGQQVVPYPAKPTPSDPCFPPPIVPLPSIPIRPLSDSRYVATSKTSGWLELRYAPQDRHPASLSTDGFTW